MPVALGDVTEECVGAQQPFELLHRHVADEVAKLVLGVVLGHPSVSCTSRSACETDSRDRGDRPASDFDPQAR